jgi:hypothetical protein
LSAGHLRSAFRTFQTAHGHDANRQTGKKAGGGSACGSCEAAIDIRQAISGKAGIAGKKQDQAKNPTVKTRNAEKDGCAKTCTQGRETAIRENAAACCTSCCDTRRRGRAQGDDG